MVSTIIYIYIYIYIYIKLRCKHLKNCNWDTKPTRSKYCSQNKEALVYFSKFCPFLLSLDDKFRRISAYHYTKPKAKIQLFLLKPLSSSIHPYFLRFIDFFSRYCWNKSPDSLSVIWLPQGQLWATNKESALLTLCYSSLSCLTYRSLEPMWQGWVKTSGQTQ